MAQRKRPKKRPNNEGGGWRLGRFELIGVGAILHLDVADQPVLQEVQKLKAHHLATRYRIASIGNAIHKNLVLDFVLVNVGKFCCAHELFFGREVRDGVAL